MARKKAPVTTETSVTEVDVTETPKQRRPGRKALAKGFTRVVLSPAETRVVEQHAEDMVPRLRLGFQPTFTQALADLLCCSARFAAAEAEEVEDVPISFCTTQD